MDAEAIEQMNKVRASLGLQPLAVPGKAQGLQFKDAEESGSEEEDLSTLDKRHAAAGGNWQRLEDERIEKLGRQKRKDAAKKQRDAAQRHAKLEGKGLGDNDNDEQMLDTRTWLLQQRKRQKKIEQARKLEAELAERERQMQADYTAKDLAGVKVGHEIEEFDEMTGEKILTLKDAAIGEGSEDDELENQDLIAKEKLEERLQLKKKRPDYDPTEQAESNAVLTKYDQEIDGKKSKRFTLDGLGTSKQAQQRRADDDVGTKSHRTIKINLDSLIDMTPANDYLEPSTVKIKKPKKKKDKKKREKQADDGDDDFTHNGGDAAETNAIHIENGQKSANGIGVKRALELDDDALQARLAEQRREVLRTRRRLDAAELVKQMAEEMPIDEDHADGGLLFDETTEFVANLKKPDEVTAVDGHESQPQINGKDEQDQDGDTSMTEQSYAALQDVEDTADHQPETNTADTTTTGLEAEESMAGQGVAASLSLLRKRGLISDEDDKAAEKNRQRNQFLADKQALIAEFDAKAKEQREIERKSGRWDKMSNRDRDEFARRQNEARDQYLSRLQAEMFNAQYKPDVKLQYFDEFGRSMNEKEAFKHLSHSFHGKSSGKQKTEKRLKKIADEKKEMSKGVLQIGSEGGMLNVQGREGKRTKQAGVRLQ